VATGSTDHTIRIWDPDTGTLLQVLRGHTSDVFSAVFEPTGRFLVSQADDATVRVWDLTLGETLMELPYRARWQNASFSPAGRYLVITDYRGSARLYTCDVCLSDDDLLALARSRVTRPLTPEQRRTFLHR
jgi:WD40 repeat protein